MLEEFVNDTLMSLTLERIPPVGCFGSEPTAQVRVDFCYIFSITMVVFRLLEHDLNRICYISGYHNDVCILYTSGGLLSDAAANQDVAKWHILS